MAGSGFGNLFRITTFGESHGKALGVVVDGCPAGIPMRESIIQQYLDKRKPGGSAYGTKRKEGDSVTILSGVMDQKTTGTPIAMLVANEDQKSRDYSEISSYYRPGHADYTFDQKYGFRDYRGGGRSSGRETIGRVAGGAIALTILKELKITVTAYVKSIGPVEIDRNASSLSNIPSSPVFMPDLNASAKAEEYLKKVMEQNDSAGGVIECILSGVPAGIGEPVFDKLDANLAKAILSIGAVKGFEIGSGFHAATVTGSENNDFFSSGADGGVKKATNCSGGVLGGISDGSDIVFRAAFKPTPSIAKLQKTVNKDGENIEVSIKGRHDPIIVPRAVVVVESMAALTLVDLLLQNMTARIDFVKHFYNEKRNDI